ncbi:right-handed parallel beta-helix repeat-containing protein [Piscinibacter terrae]|uniref:Right-handed parallel beta-helix repeat-containing protein n=1 Tax=Piscinibacter terrae TaxID=2496871 RepID=A0A3N7HVD1_9BURK|nr:right-handed parallel beta-helix repeat-containing protein [Albitalea terrae]RQP26328.1 right-handed parallel beta-helix repeat-containing protein [Albitalea terrae]
MTGGRARRWTGWLHASLFVFGLAFPLLSPAANYYLSDCQAGAASGCVPGDDDNPGTSPASPWRSIAKLNTRVEGMGAGDHVYFARGASFKDATIAVFVPKSNRHKPVVFESYAPAWGPAAAKPILMATKDNGVFSFADSGNADHDEGYVVRGLDLRGTAASGTGIFIFNDVDYITLEDLSITGFALGVQCSAANTPEPGAKGWNDFITLRNSRIAGNGAQGILTLCHHVTVENNVFDDNGFERAMLDHNVYIEGGEHVVFRGNAIINNGRHDRVALKCQSVPLVVHGRVRDLLIENNFIGESNATDGCWGLTVDVVNDNDSTDGFEDVVIRGNRIVNVGGLGIGMVGCQRCAIENNHIMWTMKSKMDRVAIAVPNRPNAAAPADKDLKSDQIAIRNNSIYIASATAHTSGIKSNDDGNGHSVVSNLIVFDAASSDKATCFVTDKHALSRYAAFGHNLCFREGGAGRWSDRYKSLSAAQSEGWDLGSLAVDPQLLAAPSAANDWWIGISAQSPAHKAAHPRSSIRIDIGAFDPSGARR